MPISIARRPRARGLAAVLIALAALAVAAVPVTAAGWSTPQKVAGPGTFWMTGISSEGKNIVVGWLENGSNLVYRVSTNRGFTFAPPVSLGAANPAAVTLCGGFVAAVRVNTGAGTVVLDLRTLDGATSTTRTIASGRYPSLGGIGAACVGGHQIATVWDEYVGGKLHLKVAVVPLTESLPPYEVDLGTAHLYRARQIVANEGAIWVAWCKQHTIQVQKLNVADDATKTVTLGRRTQVARFTDAPGALVAVSGNRLYVAYAHHEDAVYKISNDGGQTFGRAKMLFDSTPDQPVDLVGGIAAAENVFVASVHLGPWCVGCVGTNMAVYSTNWGHSWTSGPQNVGGYMGVAVFGSGSAVRIAQEWDNRTSHETYGDPGYVKFSTGTP